MGEYAIRIPANKTLELEIEDILFRPAGRPSRKPLVRYKSFHDQADRWTTARRVVAKVEHHAGELFPRVGFIVTTLPLSNRAVVRFYNKRGTAEQWTKEGKHARSYWLLLAESHLTGPLFGAMLQRIWMCDEEIWPQTEAKVYNGAMRWRRWTSGSIHFTRRTGPWARVTPCSLPS